MAKINGVQIKNLKSYLGHEGYCHQGNVYLNGKKLGFWSQDSWGGCDNYDFDESVLKKAVNDYKDGFPDDYELKSVMDADSLMGDIVFLMEIEKDFKKETKKGGYNTIIYFYKYFQKLCIDVPTKEGHDATEQVMNNEQLKGLVEKLKKKFDTEPKVWIAREEDFDMTVNKENPIPNIFIHDII